MGYWRDRQSNDQLQVNRRAGAFSGLATGEGREQQRGESATERQQKTRQQLRPGRSPFGVAARLGEDARPRWTLGRFAYSRVIPPR